MVMGRGAATAAPKRNRMKSRTKGARTRRITSRRLSRTRGFNDARAHDDITIIESERLPRRDGTLGLMEHKTCRTSVERNSIDILGFVSGTNLRTKRTRSNCILCRIRIDPFRAELELAAHQTGLVTDHHHVARRIHGHDILRTSGGDTEAAALAHGVGGNAIVAADDFTVHGLDVALGELDFAFQEVSQRAREMKHTSWLSGLSATRSPARRASSR